MSNAYHEGREAAATGDTLCPYLAGDDRDDWITGYESEADSLVCGR